MTSRTGGGVGTNQYQTRGLSAAPDPSEASRSATATLASAATAYGDVDVMTDDGDDESREEFVIPEENMERLRKDIDRLTKRAEKLGVPPPVLEELGDVEETDERGFVSRSVRVKVTGEPPRYNGWGFVAVVDLDPDDKDSDLNVVHTLPDVVPDPGWREMHERCDHCRVHNRGRKKLVVVENDEGTRQVVGSTCLKDFLGHASPQGIAAWAEIMSSLDDVARGYTSRGPVSDPSQWRLDPDQYLGWVAANIRQFGWTSRSVAYETQQQSTANSALNCMEMSPAQRHYAGVTAPTDADQQLAEDALKWAQEEIELGRNDYLDNLAAVTQKSSYRYRDIGIAASVISGYQNHLARQAEQQAKAQAGATSQHIGATGERREFSGVVTSVHPFETQYGTSAWVEITGDDGNVLKWKSSSYIPVQGDRLEGKATIKDHDEYRGVKQTVVTRPRWKDV